MVVGRVNSASFANQPANVLTTTKFVNQIKTTKGDKRYKVTVLNESDLKKKMHALLGVGQGQNTRPWLILHILRHQHLPLSWKRGCLIRAEFQLSHLEI